jgi:hypothetical protein
MAMGVPTNVRLKLGGIAFMTLQSRRLFVWPRKALL